MKVQYNSEVDVLSIVFSENPVEESDEEKPGVILDYDRDGNVVGLGILDASKRMGNPMLIEYAVTTSRMITTVVSTAPPVRNG
jgi:uncharacterized protein YuzE